MCTLCLYFVDDANWCNPSNELSFQNSKEDIYIKKLPSLSLSDIEKRKKGAWRKIYTYHESRSVAPQLDFDVGTNNFISYTYILHHTLILSYVNPLFTHIITTPSTIMNHEMFQFFMHVERNAQHTTFTFQIQQMQK